MQTAVVAAAMGVLFIVAYGDLRTRRIPNPLTVALAILGLAKMMLAGDPIAAARTIGASAVVFTVAFTLFWRGVLGGGDAKLLTAMVLLVGSRELLEFLFVMIMCGGVLAVGILSRDRFLRHHCPRLRQVRTHLPADRREPVIESAVSTVPYAVAITAAGIFTFILKPLF